MPCPRRPLELDAVAIVHHIKHQSHFCTYLVPDVPLGLLALVRELGSERDLFALALLHRLLRGLLDPLELFLQCRGVTALETDFEESDKG